jgi:hypothetical protein
MSEVSDNVFGRIVFENIKPEQLKSVMREVVLKVNEQTKVSVKHAQRPVDLSTGLNYSGRESVEGVSND